MRCWGGANVKFCSPHKEIQPLSILHLLRLLFSPGDRLCVSYPKLWELYPGPNSKGNNELRN